MESITPVRSMKPGELVVLITLVEDAFAKEVVNGRIVVEGNVVT